MTKVWARDAIVAEGTEADVLIAARVRVEKVDEENGLALICFTDIAPGKVNPEEATTWVSASAFRECKPITARVELHAGQWEKIRELVAKADPEQSWTDTRQIVRAIDDAIGPQWLKDRKQP